MTPEQIATNYLIIQKLSHVIKECSDIKYLLEGKDNKNEKYLTNLMIDLLQLRETFVDRQPERFDQLNDIITATEILEDRLRRKG